MARGYSSTCLRSSIAILLGYFLSNIFVTICHCTFTSSTIPTSLYPNAPQFIELRLSFCLTAWRGDDERRDATCQGYSAFWGVCTDFLRSFYTSSPKMRSVPVVHVLILPSACIPTSQLMKSQKRRYVYSGSLVIALSKPVAGMHPDMPIPSL
jgi:hypothetical protein